MGSAPEKIWFVGTGPGDPELITVKGMRLLEDADVVIYAGSLVSDKVLGYCRKKVEAYDSASMHLEEMVSIMSKAAKEGKKVVRLHTGDPSLYGAMREQAELLEKEGMPYAVVPGVSSAFASAAALKRELTAPGISQTVIFTRVAGKTPVPEKERLRLLASHNATICIFLSVNMIDTVVEELAEGGYPADTPVAVVYRASWEDEKKVVGSLATIASKVKEAGITRQALIIAGRAIGDESSASLLYDKDFSHGFRTGGE